MKTDVTLTKCVRTDEQVRRVRFIRIKLKSKVKARKRQAKESPQKLRRNYKAEDKSGTQRTHEDQGTDAGHQQRVNIGFNTQGAIN